jgi:protein TonB
MAYRDQSAQSIQRLAIVTVVALLQGAAIVALINGLAVNFIAPPPDDTLVGQQIPITPPIIPEAKPEDPLVPPVERPITRPPVNNGFVLEPYNPPLGPALPQSQPDDFRTISPPAPPPQPPMFPPRGASPRGDPRNWVTSNDYTAADTRAGNSGTVGFTLRIGTDGAVQSCAITRSSGSRSLDDATCRLLTRRARFRPASDGDGALMTGEYSNSVRWVIPD